MMMDKGFFLEGQLLIAMPGIGDPRFERSVIFMCSHSPEGAMGIVINKQVPDVTFPELLEQLSIIAEEDRISLKQATNELPVQFGGPVETGRGFVLHSCDYHAENHTLPIDDSVALTATLDVLRAIAQGNGPRNALLALGYAGWGPGQLESEIQRNGWLHCEADETLIFNSAIDDKYIKALGKIGIDLSQLSGQAGHA